MNVPICVKPADHPEHQTAVLPGRFSEDLCTDMRSMISRVNFPKSLTVKSSCLNRFGLKDTLAQGDFRRHVRGIIFHFRVCQLRFTHKKAQAAKNQVLMPHFK